MDNRAPDRTPRPYNSPVPPEKLPPQVPRPRLAVFGGTFNPVHMGHLWLAGTVLRQNLADEVLFVPAGVPPHKPVAEITAGTHRLEMLRAALAAWPAFSVSDIELQNPEQLSYTYDTLHVMTRAFPDHSLTFLMGLDCLHDLASWHRAQELVSQFNFIIIPRPGVTAPNFVDLADVFGGKNARKLLASVVEIPPLAISASEVRMVCASGKVPVGLVSEPVWAYIQEHGLYGVKPTRRTHG